MLRRIIFIVLCVACAVLLYCTIGYTLRGLNGATLVGEYENAHFVGYYMLASPFAVGFVITAVCAVATGRRVFGNRKLVQETDD